MIFTALLRLFLTNKMEGGGDFFVSVRLKKKQFLQTAEEAVPIQALPVLLTEEAPANFKIYENKKKIFIFLY